MIKKVLRILGRAMIGLVALYLFAAWVAVPVAGKWIVPGQARKITGQTVKIRSVFFNPFLLRLSVNGLQIKDGQDKVMAGFDRLSVDVSALGLLKNVTWVESVVLDGMTVDAVLEPDGKINLLKLIPAPAEGGKSAPSAEEQKQMEEAQQPNRSEDLPTFKVNEISVTNGTVRFEDRTVTPEFKTVLSKIDIQIKDVSSDPEVRTDITFSARLDKKGAVFCEARTYPLKDPIDIEAGFSLNDYAMTVLSPYTGKFTGRELADGKMDLKLNYRIADNTITAGHDLLIQRFDFGKKVQSKDALNLPLGLVVGLLEDPQGRIKISLPVTGDLNDPDFKYLPFLGQVIRNFFIKLATKPFSFLASMIAADSGVEDLGYVNFAPGSSELSPEEKAKLKTLAKGLKERPRLTLKINGAYDPDADWEEIRKQVFLDEYKELRAESEKPEVEVMHQLYQRRFGLRALWDLVNGYEQKYPEGGFEKELEADIRHQLIEHAPADKLALDVLAQTRANAVRDAILEDDVDDADRVSVGASKAVQSSMGKVPLEMTLTVYQQDGEDADGGAEDLPPVPAEDET